MGKHRDFTVVGYMWGPGASRGTVEADCAKHLVFDRFTLPKISWKRRVASQGTSSWRLESGRSRRVMGEHREVKVLDQIWSPVAGPGRAPDRYTMQIFGPYDRTSA